MANDDSGPRPPAADELLIEKRGRLRSLLALTQEALLVVNLEDLDPILVRKETLLGEIQRLDKQLEQTAPSAKLAATGVSGMEAKVGELGQLMEAILTNEQALEERVETERSRVRSELKALERQTRVKRYLESTKPKQRKIDLTR